MSILHGKYSSILGDDAMAVSDAHVCVMRARICAGAPTECACARHAHSYGMACVALAPLGLPHTRPVRRPRGHGARPLASRLAALSASPSNGRVST